MTHPLRVTSRSLVAAFTLTISTLMLAANPAWAARNARLYEVNTVATDSNGAAQEAMRAALVRATGRRDADQDPAFAGLLTDARRFVQILRPTTNPAGALVTLDGAAIERAVAAAGKSVWPRERPLVLVVLVAPLSGSDATAARESLEDAANFRGLPVVVATTPVGGLAATDAGAEAALAAARSQGADATLIGRGSGDAGWRWSLYTASAIEAFDGSLTSGIHGAADALASSAQSVLAQPEADVTLRVEGVGALRDYAGVTRALAATPGVRSVTVVEAGASSLVLRVVARGGADALMTLLARDAHLRSTATDGGMLVYQYQP